MVESHEERRFDEREFALILRRAATLQQGDTARPPRSGLSLTEIESIAAEAGIDPGYVRQAVSMLARDTPTLGSRLLGAPARFQRQQVLRSPPDRESLAAVLDIARTEFGRLGATREAFDGLEWTARDDYGRAWVAVLAHGDQPRIIVGADRTDGAWVLGILLTIGGLIAGGAIAALTGLEPGPALPAAGALGGLAAARTLWRRTIARWQGRVQRVLDRVAGLASSRQQAR